MKTNCYEFDNVNLTIGKGLIVGSEEIKKQFLARTIRECKHDVWKSYEDTAMTSMSVMQKNY